MVRERRPERIIKLLFRGLIPILMLLAGVVLMVSKGSGWLMIIGTPITVLGTVFLIYTYDEVIRRTVVPMSEELTRCALCGKLTPRVAGINPEDTICSRCKKEVSRGIGRMKKKKRL